MMRSGLMVLAVWAGLVLAAPSHACINDGTTFKKEQEFKSQYLDQPEPTSPASGGIDVVAWGMSGTGVLLFVGAVMITLPRRGRSGKQSSAPPFDKS